MNLEYFELIDRITHLDLPEKAITVEARYTDDFGEDEMVRAHCRRPLPPSLVRP